LNQAQYFRSSGGGDFELPPYSKLRETSMPEANLNRPGRDEPERTRQSAVKPDIRFHYRYLAADLAWEAAELMPDGSDETARVLCEAGTWLKIRDPQAADRFYKTLVRRCGNTSLGKEAENLRWFPKMETPTK
jgi:hypothetical protein